MIYEFNGFSPVIHESAFVHPQAAVTGNVVIGKDVYIGPGAAIRGDWGGIVIEDGCNVQENCTVHMFPGKSITLKAGAHVGHGAIIHGANLGRNCLIGMNAVVMDDAEIGDECIVGALSFVKAEMKIPPRSLVVGNPAQIVRQVSDDMMAWKTEGTRLYQQLPEQMRTSWKPVEPLRKMPENRPIQETNYFTLSESRKKIMPAIELKLPKMGESITEATIIKWLKKPGDPVEAEEMIVEVATDKVDSDVPSPVRGILTEILVGDNEVVKVGQVMALIAEAEGGQLSATSGQRPAVSHQPSAVVNDKPESTVSRERTETSKPPVQPPSIKSNPDAFLSPLVISIAQQENLSLEEVQSIPGTGTDGRITKSDVFRYLKDRKYPLPRELRQPGMPKPAYEIFGYNAPKITAGENDRVVEMDRMRQMIAGHMVYSKQTSPHVTSYVEADVTNLVEWRNKHKDAFAAKHGEKLTFTPVFVQAVAKAIVDFPMINVSVDGNKIIVHGDIHIGMATALPSGNLIVPVVRNADKKELPALAADVNRMADAARENRLKPDDIQGSTFTISNVGTFGSLMGTPIINQPEVGILALGIIKKRPEVITGEKGDEIAIRSMMFLSLSFDHRVVDGFLGGSFLRRVADYLENFDNNTTI